MKKTLSVVIPGYNIEKFIDKCLNSFICEEALKDCEVIIVNDGSKDNTSKLAHEYSNKYPDFFVVIDKENGGHGSVINSGIQAARGKYFKIVDGDDWVITENFLNLILKLRKTDVDMLCSTFNFVTDVTWEEKPFPFTEVTYDKVYNFSDIPPNQPILLHSITIKTDVLRDNNIKMSEKRFYDDMEYDLYPLRYVNTIMFSEPVVYQYRMGVEGQSVSFKGMQKHIQDLEDIIFFLIDAYNDTKKSNASKAVTDYMLLRISGMVQDYFEASLMFPVSDKKRRAKTIAFDKRIKEKCMDIYNATGKKKVFKVFRGCGYQCFAMWQYLFSKVVMYNIKKVSKG